MIPVEAWGVAERSSIQDAAFADRTGQANGRSAIIVMNSRVFFFGSIRDLLIDTRHMSQVQTPKQWLGCPSESFGAGAGFWD